MNVRKIAPMLLARDTVVVSSTDHTLKIVDDCALNEENCAPLKQDWMAQLGKTSTK